VVFSPPSYKSYKKGKEVKKYMKRIIKVLVVSALMVVLMATSASPAFAGSYNHTGKGWGVDGKNGGCEYGPSSSSTKNGEGWYWGKCTNINYNT
jgi:hypothetical protein